MSEKREEHFVLVHGSLHGAWCWYKVATRLRSEGHRVTALDSAACGINQKQVQEVQSYTDYYEPLMEFMANLPPDEKVILVGHSYGGYGLSIAMEAFPEKIAVAVFVTAMMPGPDLTYFAISQEIYNKVLGSFKEDVYTVNQNSDGHVISYILKPEALASKLYQLSPTEDLTLATMLVRPHSSQADANASEIVMASKEKYGSVRRVYIVADQDILLPEEIQRWMIQLNPPDEVKVIQGSDHMTMFSKPQELSSFLLAIAQQYSDKL
ncbi:Polyneuridine-aldehyde esterase [Heracleum sosnowskyi]|uniref:Polyneuridine-aldehyde esterase n=1 Tax=Heracleum sosnowskyi TaxID=360622 RepID=A0AAD8M950_9APIA|nr:Polyneuridine-aldehyde esterase [Heracleum sosnowskyi]